MEPECYEIVYYNILSYKPGRPKLPPVSHLYLEIEICQKSDY